MSCRFAVLGIIGLGVFLGSQSAGAQVKELKGRVVTVSDAENIHVINETFKKYTITDEEGEFSIEVRLNDVLVFSSIQHKSDTIIVNNDILKKGFVVVSLEEQVNMLNEVVVGKILTGNMFSDVGNVNGEPMTSLKAGIHSYQGKPKTQAERRLQDGTDLAPKLGGSLGGLGFSVRLIPILNAMSGRSKVLRKNVVLEEKEILVRDIKTRLSKDLFSLEPLHDNYAMEYFYFVSESEDFLERCKNKTDILILEYLLVKLKEYKHNKYDNKD